MPRDLHPLVGNWPAPADKTGRLSVSASAESSPRRWHPWLFSERVVSCLSRQFSGHPALPRGAWMPPCLLTVAGTTNEYGRFTWEPYADVQAIHVHAGGADGYAMVPPGAPPARLRIVVRADPEPASATLVITDEHGEPLPAARIICQPLCARDGEPAVVVVSDTRGELVLPLCRPGTYAISLDGILGRQQFEPVSVDLPPGPSRRFVRF